MIQTQYRPFKSFRSIKAGLLLAAATATWGLGYAAESAAWQLSVSSHHHSDSLPLRWVGDDSWMQELRPRDGRNLSYIEDELRLERQQGDWSLALLARSSATLVASEDALNLAGLLARGQTPAGNVAWNNEIKLRGFNGVGLEVGRQYRLNEQWSSRVTAQGLLLSRWREREISGPAAFDAGSGNYSFGLHSRELDDKLRFPFQTSVDAQGAGFLLAGELNWQADHAFAGVKVHEGGWLHWNGMPQQRMLLNTSTQAVDADGFLIYQPLLQGQNSQSSTTRVQPWHVSLKAGWVLANQQRFSASTEHIPDYGWLPAVAWQGHGGPVGWGLEWRFHEHRATLSLAWQAWRLRLGADRLGGAVQSRELGLSYLLPF